MKVEHGCTVATISGSRGILVVGGATGDDVVKASRETEELLNAIIKNDVKLVYKKVRNPTRGRG